MKYDEKRFEKAVQHVINFAQYMHKSEQLPFKTCAEILKECLLRVESVSREKLHSERENSMF